MINLITDLIAFQTGGVCTHFQILSEVSRKYFNKAILMSGNALLYSALSTVENHVEMAYNMAEKWKQPQHNLNDLVKLLKIVPAEHFVEFSALDLNGAATFKFPFAPILESMTHFFENNSFARDK